ncbi:MAG: HDIG domain-containing protein [Deltaproteobacteria bacterium]|nr:HDIG domain-containing protein [Deltaproteobacteria bacterium]
MKTTDRAKRKGGIFPLLLLWAKIKGRPLLRTFKSPRVQRWLLLIVVSLSVATFLSPTLEVAPPNYKVGDVAVKDVISDRDLLVKDKTATEKKREDAANKVLPVYDYDPSVIPEVEGVIHSAFSLMRRYRAGEAQKGERDLKGEVEATLGFHLAPHEYQALKDHRFNGKVLKGIVDVIAPLMNKGVVSNKELLLQEEGIVVRDIKTGEEVIKRDLHSLLDYHEAKEVIKKTLEGPQVMDIPADLRGVILKAAHNLIFPNLTFNRQETNRRRQQARNRVKPVLFQIKRGEVLLEKGERVTEEGLLKLEAIREGWHKGNTLVMILGLIFLTCFFVTTFYLFSMKNIKKVSLANKDILFFVLVLISSLGMARISVFVAEALANTFARFPLSSYYYFFPIAAGAMLIRIVLNSEVALVYSIFVSLFSGLLLREGIFLPIFYLIGSIAGAHSVARCDQRFNLIKGGLIVGLTNLLLISFQGMITARIFEIEALFDLLMGLAGGAVAGMVVVGVAPVVESIFGYTTDIKLLELANLDQPTLKELLMKAPGSYHHSMIVGSLVEAGAKAINVNPLLARVSAYYHDIGKIKKPQYFIENQMIGNNRHDKLTPSMSSLILVSHVKDGVELAKRHKLGNKIIDIIRQHHGTRLINYFYQKAKEQEDPGVQEVDERDFRYLGPKPQTKEAGLVMLADAVEAASRTLENPTPAHIQGLVQKITNDIFIDGQLDECELTLKDLHEIAKSFNIVLNAVHHHRIEYPEAQPEGERQKNGGVGPKPAKETKGKARRGKENGRKDIKRLGVSRERIEHPSGR